MLRTLYGDVPLASPRLHRCPCQDKDSPATLLPLRALIPGQVAPERLYLDVLDRLHITMRLTVLSQYARDVAHQDKAEGARLPAAVDSIKRLLWHGNQYRAGEEIAFFEGDVDDLEVSYLNLGKLKRAAHEFAV